MGGQGAGADTDSPATSTSSAGSAGSARLSGGRRWAVFAAYLLAAAILFTVYLQLSRTAQLNSDSANILLMGSDLLHGNLLLHGWYMSDVPFFPTEIPQYALLESFLGSHMQTAHVAAAMTYTLTFLLAVLLARSGSTGREALVRTLIAAGIMLAPQFGNGVFALDLSVGHIGASVPLLLTWLLLDKLRPRWWLPLLTAALLGWTLVADPIVYVVGVGPLGVACAARVIRGLVKGAGRVSSRIAGVWYDLALGTASVAAVALARGADDAISALGGYTVNQLPFYLTPWHYLHNNVQALWKVLEIFGANYGGHSGIWLILAFGHLASVLVVAWALARAARRFFSVSLVDQVLAVAIVLNVVLYLFTNAADNAAREVAVIVPFGAVLAARMLVRPAGKVTDAGEAGSADAGSGREHGAAASPGRARLIRLAAWATGIVVLAGYAAGLGYEIVQPPAPPANTDLASWLVAHHLRYGLSGYWTSSSVTVDSDNRVQLRALTQHTLQRDLWMSKVDWYDPKLHYANFIVLDSQPGNFSYWQPRALVTKYFGVPAQTYRTGPYTIMVWKKNLLNSVPSLPGGP